MMKIFVDQPDSTGRIGVKIDNHRKMFNPYENRSMLPQAAQDELTLKFTPEVIALYDTKKAERDATIELEATPLTNENIYNRAMKNPFFKALVKRSAKKESLTAEQIKIQLIAEM